MKKIMPVFLLTLAVISSGCTVGRIEALLIAKKPVYKAEYDSVPFRVGGAFQGEDGLLHIVLLRDEVRRTLFSGRTTFRGIDLLEIRLLKGKLAAADFWRVSEEASEHYVLETGSIETEAGVDPVEGIFQAEFKLKEQRPTGRPVRVLHMRSYFKVPMSEPFNFKVIKADVGKMMKGEEMPPPAPAEPDPAPEEGP